MVKAEARSWSSRLLVPTSTVRAGGVRTPILAQVEVAFSVALAYFRPPKKALNLVNRLGEVLLSPTASEHPDGRCSIHWGWRPEGMRGWACGWRY